MSWQSGCAAALAAWLLLTTPLQAQAAPRVLRDAFEIAETGFDPAQISDSYSRTITPHISWLIGYRRPLFRNEFWHFVDIDPQRRAVPAGADTR